MADIQAVKNQLMSLSYQEKMLMSEWLHTQIDFERAEETKRKAEEISGKFGNFLNKAANATKTAGNSLAEQFKKVTGSNNETPTK